MNFFIEKTLRGVCEKNYCWKKNKMFRKKELEGIALHIARKQEPLEGATTRRKGRRKNKEKVQYYYRKEKQRGGGGGRGGGKRKKK